jgi:hypothetical protein
VVKAYEHFGIDPDEVWGALYDAATNVGVDPDTAAAEARAGIELQRQVELQRYEWNPHRIPKGGSSGS